MIHTNKKNCIQTAEETIFECFGKKEQLGNTNHLSMSQVEIKENSKTQAHWHTTFEEFYYVVEGNGVFVIDDVFYPFSKEDCFLIEKKEIHQIITKDQCAKFWVICVPAWDGNDMHMEERSND